MKYEVIKLNEEISYIKVNNGKNIEVELCNFGAGVRSFKYKGENIILEPSREEYPFLPDFYGKSLARVAGRIKCHGILNGKEYNLAETMQEYCLHGGDIRSQSYQPWKFEIKERSNKIQVIFVKKSKNGELGFPGAVTTKVIYEVTEKDELKILFKGKTPTSTLLNLSNHNYYNFLNSLDVSEYKLKVNASKVCTIDEYTFINGIKDVDKHDDFRKLSKLAPRLNYFEKQHVGTIDFTWIFDEVSKSKPQMILQNKDIKLSMYTDYPAANIYVDSSLKEIKFSQYKDGKGVKRRAIALEPQLINYNVESLVLNKGQKYDHFIKIKLKDLRS